jgi:hypothetical protein
MSLHHALPSIALLFALTMPALHLDAQSSAGDTQSRVALAVVDSMPVATARAMIVRREGEPPLVVLDRKHADPGTLDLALAMLSKLERTPLVPGQQQVVPIQGGVSRTPATRQRTAFLQAQLRAIAARPTGTLGTLGRGQHIQFTNERTLKQL